MNNIILKMSIVILIAILAASASPFPSEPYSAGYINVNRGAQLFYWLQFNRIQSTSAPLILWLQGGPGCSSMIDQFTDIGAFNVYPNGTIYSNPTAWNAYANVLFVDQPVCTGLSFCHDISQSPNNEVDIAADLYLMIKGVMKLFPALKGSQLYISGHSYGGHYVPSAAKYFIEQNDSDIVVNGISIGDGWISAQIQGLQYSDFAYAKGLAPLFTSLTSRTAITISNLLHSFNFDFSAEKAYYFVGQATLLGINPRFCEYNYKKVICPDNSAQVPILLNRADIRAALNVTSNVTYEICSWPVVTNMLRDSGNATIPALEFVLSHHIKTIMYVGKLDYLCNEMGLDGVISHTRWQYQDEFNSTVFSPYYVEGQKRGEIKTYGWLTYIKLDDCGHGVEQDDPVAAFDIMEQLIN